MKKLYPVLGILFLSFSLHAQMYVSPNTYMYVGDQFVYVTGNVNLNAATSNIYLRRDAQLLQGTAAVNGNNIGNGALSVYQEGSVNNFQYNYWCSPVGGTTIGGNQPFSITQIGVPNVNLNSTSFAANTPTAGLDGTSSNGALSISSRWIYKFANSTLYAHWAYVGTAAGMSAGQGFTMKGTSGGDTYQPYAGAGANRSAVATAKASGNQRYDFRGIPNDGTINVPLLLNTTTLTGNPYPSAIDLQDLLIDNGPSGLNVCDGTALFWDHDKTINSHILAFYRGGYGVYNPAGGAGLGVYTPATYKAPNALGMPAGAATGTGPAFERKFSPIGQGFMVRNSLLAGNIIGNFVINNTHRRFVKEAIVNNSEFARTAQNEDERSGDDRYGFFGDIPNIAGKDYTKISKAPTPHILVNTLLSTGAIRQMALVFVPNAVEGYDASDSKTGESGLPIDIYFPLLDAQFVHNANKFSIDNKYPLGFKNDVEAKFIIRVAQFVNFDKTREVFLHDKQLDLYYDIRNEQAEVTLPAGVNTTRYEITFKDNKKPVEGEFVSAVTELNVFQNNVNNLLTIKNPSQLDLAALSLFDVTGKSILAKTNLGKNEVYEFSTANLSDGVYIVKLITGTNQEITKKVSISKLN